MRRILSELAGQAAKPASRLESRAGQSGGSDKNPAEFQENQLIPGEGAAEGGALSRLAKIAGGSHRFNRHTTVARKTGAVENAYA